MSSDQAWAEPTAAEILELRAKVLDYEHVLAHVAEAHDGGCVDCRRLAQAALDGVGREDFREIAREMSEQVGPD